MDVGSINPIIVQPVSVSLPTPAPSASSAPAVLPPITTGTTGQGSDAQAGVDLQAAEQQRLQAVQKAAQDIANVYVVSDQKFAIYKDATGQYITRFTNLRSGQVTYIPEPQLLQLSGSAASVAINIEA